MDTASTPADRPPLQAAPTARAIGAWLLATVLLTAVLVAFRDRLESAHIALAYLLLVLSGSARRGRVIGLVLSLASFLAFNFFLIPPYNTLALHDPLDLWVLVAFLVTGAVAAQLFHRVQRLAADFEHVQALREADGMKDAVLASVSHDLRTPLTTIRALAAELRAGGDERAVIIEEEADRLNRMVGDLLDLSRLRTGSLHTEVQLVAAEDVVGAALQRLGGAGAADRIAVRLPADGSLPVGRIDFTHTLRILVNLLENALRHSPPGTRIELEVSHEGAELVMRVLDRGPGIDEAERARIFEPFHSHANGAPARGRTGLGLAIARGLAAAQSGTIAYWPRDGGGSVFEVRLPGQRVDEALREDEAIP